jgi:hypothetical protein
VGLEPVSRKGEGGEGIMVIVFGSREARYIAETDHRIALALAQAEQEAEDEASYPYWLVKVPRYYWYRVRAIDEMQARERAEEGGSAVEETGNDDLPDWTEAEAEREKVKDTSANHQATTR